MYSFPSTDYTRLGFLAGWICRQRRCLLEVSPFIESLVSSMVFQPPCWGATWVLWNTMWNSTQTPWSHTLLFYFCCQWLASYILSKDDVPVGQWPSGCPVQSPPPHTHTHSQIHPSPSLDNTKTVYPSVSNHCCLCDGASHNPLAPQRPGPAPQAF